MMLLNRIKPTALALLLAISPPALALDLDNMTDVEKDRFGQQVRAYLLENPEVIMEAYSIYQQNQQLAEIEQDIALVGAYLDEIQNDGYSWVGGNPDGDITMVEFMDYKCGYCRKAHDEVVNLVKTDGNIRLVVKEFPILGEESYTLSSAAIATLQSLGPDAYKKIYNKFIKHNGPVTNDAIIYIADKLGLDGQAIIAKMGDQSVQDVISKTRQLGDNLRISGTPTFIFNDQIVRGYIPEQAMVEIVAELRNPSQ